MGYAKLWFDNAGANTITHVLHDIVGVITGTYTSTSQLTVADKVLSEIVNTRNSNWSFLYPSAHGAKGNANTSWVLTAPCESSNTKLKYVRISSQGFRGGAGQAGGNVLYDATSGNGVKLTCATAATSNTAVSNETYYNTSTVHVTGAGSQFTGNYITLSWSQRHLIMFGIAASGVSGRLAFTGCLETTETPISTFRNVAPFLFFYRGHFFGTNGQSFSGYAAGSGTNSLVTIPQSNTDVKYDAFLQMNHYDPTTTTASGIHNIISNINNRVDDMTLFAETSASVSIPSTFTKSSTGQNAIYMQPLFYHQSHIGIPHMYISNLADVYRVPNNIGNTFDTFTVGSNTYVYLVAETGQNYSNNLNDTYTNCAGGFALAVRKA